MWETQGHKVLHFGDGKHSTLFKMVMNWGWFIVEFTILPYKLGYHSNNYGNYIFIYNYISYIYIYHSYIIITGTAPQLVWLATLKMFTRI